MNVQLSKTRFQHGLQCLKALYYDCYERNLATPPGDVLKARFDTGHQVGELARKLFPGGVAVSAQYWEHERAVAETRRLLDDPDVPALYEAAFTCDGVRVRVDVLARNDDGAFDVVEVKASTSAKPEHTPDVAIQLYAAEGAGVPVRRAYLAHLNREYVYQRGEYDLEQLFSLEDLTDKAREFVKNEVPDELARMWDALRQDDAPDIATGRHCSKPYTCAYLEHCRKGEPPNRVLELPGVRENVLRELQSHGIDTIPQIPPGLVKLTAVQERARQSVTSGEPWYGPKLGATLRGIAKPLCFVDFEAFMAALPLYVGTRPYQQMPFQWSLHVLDESGNLSHSEYLHDDDTDPRERFAATLLAAMPDEGAIVTYSHYERTTLKRLAESYPQYAGGLTALCDRIVDLLKVVRDGYYHPDLKGSFSIKSVLPVVVPGLDYERLGIQEGQDAAAKYLCMVDGDTPDAERESIRQDLLEYCAQDTKAMALVYRTLLEATGATYTNALH